ncbi:MAG: hypothetical protein E3J87_02040 [Candidatus Cloacimonadota bacterium]|nr:MAG: hypothetical protein E3J87_02040 [Candidatus Cloacimonadota bacterium]
MYQKNEEKVGKYRAKLSSLESEISSLKRKYLFEDIFNNVRDIERKLSGVERGMRTLRQKGFIYGKDWENSVSNYKGELPNIKSSIQMESNNISNAHSFTLNQITSEISSIRSSFVSSPGNYYSHIDSLESRMSPIKSLVNNAENKLKAIIQPMVEKIDRLNAKIGRIDKGFENIEKASFKLLAGENLVDVWDAQYLKEGKKGPKGFIYLTDKRFRFEQNEDVVVSRRFLVITKKERRQKLMIDEPIGLISSSKDSEKGFFLARKEMLELGFGQGAKIRKATFRTHMDSKEVDDILDSVISGGISATMVSDAKEKAKEREGKPLPKIDKCPACGASFNKPIVKGMTHIKCDFCGKLINF